MILPLLLAAGIDGAAALQHAARLSALGPHPWGSAVGRGAAQYVHAQLKDAGLSEVRFEDFEAAGIRGTNVVGVRRGAARGILVIAAHHDTAPSAPGAYDDGGGVGVLIEVARAMAREGRGRTVMFVSFDGEEGWSQGVLCAGSNAFLERLGATSREITAALVIEMCGWRGGTPTLLPIAYADPMRPGRTVITPAWLAREAWAGAREGFPGTALGDRYVSWVYQPAVRAAPVLYYGDDVSFARRGIPALLASDSSFSAFYPWYHRPEDTADKLDAEALRRMGAAVLGAARRLEMAPPPERLEMQWFGAFGHVLERNALLAAGALSLLPLLVSVRSAGIVRLGLKGVQAAAFGVLLWREPVIALWCFGLAHLLAPLAARRWVRLAALTPAVALLLLLAGAYAKEMVRGTWLTSWELALLGTILLLALVPPPPRSGNAPARRTGRGRRAGLPKR